MFKSILFDNDNRNWLDDVYKDLDEIFKDANPDLGSKKTSTYTLKLTPDKEKGYNINYKADDGYGKLDITAEGASLDECVDNLINNLKTKTVEQKEEKDDKLTALEKENQKLKESNKDLCKTIEKLLGEKNKLEAENDELEAENIELQDINDDLVISLSQITSTVDKVNAWLEKV